MPTPAANKTIVNVSNNLRINLLSFFRPALEPDSPVGQRLGLLMRACPLRGATGGQNHSVLPVLRPRAEDCKLFRLVQVEATDGGFPKNRWLRERAGGGFRPPLISPVTEVRQ